MQRVGKEYWAGVHLTMLKIALMNDDDLLKLKIAANELASQFGWDKFLPVYLEAYDAALKRI